MINSIQCCNEIRQYLRQEVEDGNLKLSDILKRKLDDLNVNFCSSEPVAGHEDKFALYFDDDIHEKLNESQLSKITEIYTKHGF